MNLGTSASRTPLVSILAPIYNEEQFLNEMLASVVEQTYSNWELCIVDDGSDDKSLEIIRRAERMDDRVRVICAGVRMGKREAFNRAFSASQGQIIVALAGDDSWPKSALAHRVSVLSQFPLDRPSVVYSRMEMFWEDGSKLITPRRKRGSRSFPGVTLSRPLAERIFPIPATLISDDPWVRLVSEALAEFSAEDRTPVIHYRVHPGNTTIRHMPFGEMNEAFHARNLAYHSVSSQFGSEVDSDLAKRLGAHELAEKRRYMRKPLIAAATSGLTPTERIAYLVYASPVLYSIRTRFYKALTGWRGR